MLIYTVALGYGELSLTEKQALEEFYDATNGPSWRFKDNWLVGDPCLNGWFGVRCNKAG